MVMLFSYMVLMNVAYWGQWAVLGFTAILFVLVVVRHHANIVRLLHGTENKIGHKAKPVEAMPQNPKA